MACPHQGIIGETLTFTVRSRSALGAPVDADSIPTYTVYDGNTDNPISGLTNLSMVKDSDSTGLYYANISVDAIIFGIFKTYIIDIETVIATVSVAKSYTFIALGREEISAMAGVSSGDLRAVATFRGSFRQGSIADLLIKITDFDGDPLDPTSIQCVVTGPISNPSTATDVVADTSSPFQIDNGYYVYSWDLDSDQALGDYNVTWTYVLGGQTNYEYQSATVVESSSNAIPSSFYTERLIAIREALSYHLSCAQSIPIYFEQAKPSRDNTKFEFSFKNWNQSSGVKIYRNEVIINESSEVDYFNGSVTFDTQLLPQETINADYNFQWFSEEELTRYLVNALQTVNVFPPASDYNLDSVPDRFIPTILYGATKDALRNLMMCLQFQEPAQIFGGTEAAKEAFSNFETLKKNYEGDWEKLLEQKKFGPWPRIALVTSPTYTLPGGRCISLSCKGLCLIENSIFEATMQEILNLYKTYNNIEILSHSNYNGNLIFAPINHIWRSGIKDVYEVRTYNGHDIRASEEHLFFVNGKYLPVKYMKVDDDLITSDYHNFEFSRVKSIRRLKRKEMMCDLEIHGTHNLFANGIKCHNSRWFRYLFKG
jgi:hypothetical protein